MANCQTQIYNGDERQSRLFLRLNHGFYPSMAGSGSEMIGAALSGGWEFVQGIELSSEYAKIAEARIKFWKMNSGLFESLTEDEDDAPTDAQETLF